MQLLCLGVLDLTITITTAFKRFCILQAFDFTLQCFFKMLPNLANLRYSSQGFFSGCTALHFYSIVESHSHCVVVTLMSI